MATSTGIKAYGVSPKSAEDLARDRLKYFNWMKARIKAEKLNPEQDWDSERYNALLKEIAQSKLKEHDRLVLINLLEKK